MGAREDDFWQVPSETLRCSVMPCSHGISRALTPPPPIRSRKRAGRTAPGGERIGDDRGFSGASRLDFDGALDAYEYLRHTSYYRALVGLLTLMACFLFLS